MKICNLCRREKVIELLDLGKQPVCHRFLSSPEQKEYSHPVTMGQCLGCGLVQLLDPMPMDELKPRFEWLECIEPEAHLDNLVQALTRLPWITKDSIICGLSFKEDSTLARFNRAGYKNTWRIDPKTELGISDPLASVETVVNSLTPQKAEAMTNIRGKADIVIARHLIEHAFDIQEFMASVKSFIRPQGYIVLEIPDCERALNKCDYTTYWEEHITYFTPTTFRNCFGFGGLSLVHFEAAPYPLEDSYIGIAQVKPDLAEPSPSAAALKAETGRFQSFAQQLSGTRQRFKEYFREHTQTQGKVAIFGAAHMCCTFINVLELKEYIEFVVDDNPHKKGMYMPGSRLPVCGSQALLEKDIKLCLLTLSPSSEKKVLEAHQDFISKGGTFCSIFPGNPLALPLYDFALKGER